MSVDVCACVLVNCIVDYAETASRMPSINSNEWEVRYKLFNSLWIRRPFNGEVDFCRISMQFLGATVQSFETNTRRSLYPTVLLITSMYTERTLSVAT